MLHANKIVFLCVATHFNILRNIADAASELFLKVRGQNEQKFWKKWHSVLASNRMA